MTARDEDLTRLLPFAATCGVEVVERRPGAVTLRLPLDRRVQNQLGTAQAGAIFTLAEMTAGLALMEAVDPAEFWFVARAARIRFLRPARTDLTCRAAVPQKDLARIRNDLAEWDAADYVQTAEVFDTDGACVAELEGDFVFRRART